MDKIENDSAQAEFGWSERRFRQLVESVNDYAIFVTGLDGRIEAWNPGAERIFGYSADEIIGKSADVLYTPEDVAKGVPSAEMLTAAREARAGDERWHIKKDGSCFFAFGVQTPLFNGNHELTGYVKIARDLTERIELEEALRNERDNLEIKIEERTDELLREISERQRSEEEIKRLLRQIVHTQEDERKRIARDLHDHLGQQLTALRLELESLKIQCGNNSELSRQVRKVQETAQRIDSEVDFIAWELRPSVLDDLGLVVAVESYLKEWSKHYGIAADFHTRGLKDKRLSPEIEINVYRIVQEALNNVTKHAEATQVNVLLERPDHNITVIVEDNGKGFEVADKVNLITDDRVMGLLGMRERAALIGGTLEIESAPGEGTTVYVRVPVRFTD